MFYSTRWASHRRPALCWRGAICPGGGAGRRGESSARSSLPLAPHSLALRFKRACAAMGLTLADPHKPHDSLTVTGPRSLPLPPPHISPNPS